MMMSECVILRGPWIENTKKRRGKSGLLGRLIGEALSLNVSIKIEMTRSRSLVLNKRDLSWSVGCP
jgi:hypothetical protein